MNLTITTQPCVFCPWVDGQTPISECQVCQFYEGKRGDKIKCGWEEQELNGQDGMLPVMEE